MNTYNLLKIPAGKNKLVLLPAILSISLTILSIAPCFPQDTQTANPPVGNPFVRDIYTADPAAHVWKDGRLYVYPSHDVAPARGCDLMDQYHVYSTDDMVHWKDHGEILRASQVEWGRPEGG